MEQFSIWHWIIIAVVVLLALCAIWLFARAINNRRPKYRRNDAPATGPSGFGGWLLLLTISVIVSPIFLIVHMAHFEDGASADFVQKYRLVFYGEFGIYLSILALLICTAFFMARHARRFIPIYILTAISVVLMQPIDVLWSSSMFSIMSGIPFQRFFDDILAKQNVGQWASNTVFPAVVWILYVLRSRRVANWTCPALVESPRLTGQPVARTRLG